MQMSRLYVQVTQVSCFLTRYIFEAKKKMDYNILSKFRESPLFNSTKMHYWAQRKIGRTLKLFKTVYLIKKKAKLLR